MLAASLEYLKTVLLIVLGMIRAAYTRFMDQRRKVHRAARNLQPVFNLVCITLPLSFLLLIKELICCIVFSFGPLALLATSFTAATIVLFFLRISTRMGWSERTAHVIGLDVAAVIFRFAFKIWHGQEFCGMENIPPRGGALLVWYHGPMPCDYFALVAEVQYQYGRQLRSIMDRFLKNIPGSAFFLEKMGCSCDGRDAVVEQLRNGDLMGVAPGGSREALFCEVYSVNWGKRTGFARAALEAQVPIIPVFTENIREAYTLMRSLGFVWRYVYETAGIPMVPVWGGYPVKLITHIGAPIYPEETDTPETLRDKAKNAIEDMMREKQSRDPSTLKAILQRVRPRQKGQQQNGAAFHV